MEQLQNSSWKTVSPSWRRDCKLQRITLQYFRFHWSHETFLDVVRLCIDDTIFIHLGNHVWSYCRYNVGSVNTRLGCAYGHAYTRGVYYLRFSPSKAVHNKHVIHVMTEFTSSGLSSIESSNGELRSLEGETFALSLSSVYVRIHIYGCDVNSRGGGKCVRK